MSLEKVVPLTGKEGHEYFIQFSLFNQEVLPATYNIDIIDLVITLVDDKRNGFNSASTLFQISACIKEYLEDNNVVLYCYCDNKHIDRNKNKAHLSPQQYRSMLFSKMFDKGDDKTYTNSLIVIGDPANQDHYIHLISKKSNQTMIDVIAADIKGFDNK